MKWLVIGIAALVAAAGMWLFQPPDWQAERHSDLASATALITDGVLPPNLPDESRDIIVSYKVDASAAFVRFSLPQDAAQAFRSALIPVGKPTAVALAMRHPETLEGWDEVTLSARLRTGALVPRRPRDGSRWYLIVQDDGQVWGWNAPDIDPAPVGG
jgi:hypothetical protein